MMLQRILTLIVLFVVASSSATVMAQAETQVKTSVESAMGFLADRQEDEGAFGDGTDRVAPTALSLLAFLSSGQTQDVGRYGLTVRRSIDYLLQIAPTISDASKMTPAQVPIVTLALSQAFGVEPDRKQRALIHPAIESGIARIVKEIDTTTSDRFSTAWRLEALRAAQQIGIDVPNSAIDRLKALSESSTTQPITSELSYTRIGLQLLETARNDPKKLSDSWGAARDQLLLRQASDGGWPDSPEELGRIRCTSLAVISLTLPSRILPIAQP